MSESEPAAEKFKRVCDDFPNLMILTKSSTPGKIQLTFGHADDGNKSLGESVVAFALSGDLSSPSMISFNTESAFAADGDKISLPIAEVLFRAAAGDLTRSKKQIDWTPRNAVLLPLFLTEPQSSTTSWMRASSSIFSPAPSWSGHRTRITQAKQTRPTKRIAL